MRRTLKNVLKPWRKQHWCIPTVGSDFAWRMEDVLEVYVEAVCPNTPLICFDECPYQVLDHMRGHCHQSLESLPVRTTSTSGKAPVISSYFWNRIWVGGMLK